jgi:hypothetical protein
LRSNLPTREEWHLEEKKRKVCNFAKKSGI